MTAPDVKITSGASVNASTAKAPRTPCARRTRPTTTRSASSGLAAVRVVLQHHDRARGRRELALRGSGRRLGADHDTLGRQTLLVTQLEHAGTAEQRAHRIRGLGADVEPVVHPIDLQIDRGIAGE